MVQAAIDLDDELDRLYAGAPDAFVAGRNDLVRRLKAEGRRGDAERVGRLRRPTVVAWALNQVARARPDDVVRLQDLGRRLTEAQEELLGGGGAQAVRDVSAERRRLLRSLADDAGERLGSGAGSHRDEVLATLEAASLDREVGETLRAGRLEREEAPPAGFGTLLAADVAAGAAAGAEVDIDAAPARRPERDEQRRAAGDDRRERARAEARRVVEAAARVAEEARREADEARQEAEEAAREVERLEDALRLAKQEAAATRTSQGRAEREAERTDRALEHAQRELDRYT